MTDLSSNGRQNRTVTAFFDTQAMAQKAIDDLVSAGLPEGDIRLTEGTGTTAVSEKPLATEHKGFWAELKDLFLPDEDRYSYAEGLTRGGHLVSVRTDATHYDRVLDILDADGAIDMSEREAHWRSGGWAGYDASAVSGENRSAAARDLQAPDVRGPAATAEPATAASLGLAGAAPAAPVEGWQDVAQWTGTRDLSHGRTRLRSYMSETEELNDRAVDVSPTVSDPLDVRAVAAGGAAPNTDLGRIAAHMDVIAADGVTIGTVDHLDGPDRVKLTRTASPDGQHHYIPVAWIDHVDTHVHLNKASEAAKAGW